MHFLEQDKIIFCNATTASGLQKCIFSTKQHKDSLFSLYITVYIVEHFSILWIVSLWHDSQYSEPQVFMCNMILSIVKKENHC